MKCLKIPNTPEMKGVTRIADAIELYEKFKSRDIQRVWNPEQDEEYEDKDGNVFNKKNLRWHGQTGYSLEFTSFATKSKVIGW